ncbi:MAG: carboxypeptidase regulatory-like domain-containing protein [Deinococcus sp.]|nr:carboxypeptidase regulatory-like domain-containing protein [Deinococcus sp.]
MKRLLLALGLLLTACADEPADPSILEDNFFPSEAQTGAVRGMVLDEAGQPLAGVVVSGGGALAQSGPDGRFVLEDLAAGGLTVTWDGTASASGVYGALRLGNLGPIVAGETFDLSPLRLSRLVPVAIAPQEDGTLLLTSPQAPGVSLVFAGSVELPAGAPDLNGDGALGPEDLALVQVASEAYPAPLGRRAQVGLVIGVYPWGARFAQGAALVFPQAGEVLSFDAASRQWNHLAQVQPGADGLARTEPALFTSSLVALLQPAARVVSLGGKVVDLGGAAVSGAFVQTVDGRTATTDVFGEFSIRDLPLASGVQTLSLLVLAPYSAQANFARLTVPVAEGVGEGPAVSPAPEAPAEPSLPSASPGVEGDQVEFEAVLTRVLEDAGDGFTGVLEVDPADDRAELVVRTTLDTAFTAANGAPITFNDLRVGDSIVVIGKVLADESVEAESITVRQEAEQPRDRAPERPQVAVGNVALDVRSLALSAVIGVVYGPDGAPAAGVPVRVLASVSYGALPLETRSNEAGRFRLDNVPQGPLVLGALRDGAGALALLEVDDEQITAELRLAPLAVPGGEQPVPVVLLVPEGRNADAPALVGVAASGFLPQLPLEPMLPLGDVLLGAVERRFGLAGTVAAVVSADTAQLEISLE